MILLYLFIDHSDYATNVITTGLSPRWNTVLLVNSLIFYMQYIISV